MNQELFVDNVDNVQGQFTKSIEEDLTVLVEVGFQIDYPNGRLGTGNFGSVYKGVYGLNATQLRDKKGNPLRNVEPGKEFAVKVVDFQEVNKMLASRVSKVMDIREVYETEKYIMTACDHPNVVPIRMAINMGQPRVFTHQDSADQFVQHERIYLVMDLADMGSLEATNNEEKYGKVWTISQRHKITVDLFRGLKYLHDNNIIHGDIHLGNVLLFRDGNRVVAKWTDFGLGTAYRFDDKNFMSKLSAEDIHYMRENLRNGIRDDCKKFVKLLEQLWDKHLMDRHDKRTFELVLNMIKVIRNCDNLNEMSRHFSNVLRQSES